MANDNIYIYNHNTGKEVTRKMTAEEKAERDAEIAIAEQLKEAQEAEMAEMASKRQTLLNKLGITEDEAKLFSL